MPETIIGVVGAGTLSPKMIRALFNDTLEAAGDDDIVLVLPVSKTHLTDEIDTVVAWAEKNEVEVIAVGDGSLKDFPLDGPDDVTCKRGVIGDEIVAILAGAEKGREARLFVFWDDEDDDGYRTFEAAMEAGVKCFDLTNGLEELTFADDDEEEPPANAPDPVEEEPEAAPVKPEGEGINTAAEMGRLPVPDLKKMVAERNITLNREGKGRISKKAYVAAILIHDETGATEFMQTDDGAEPISDGYDEEAKEYTLDQEEAAMPGKPEDVEDDDEPTEQDLAEEAEVEAVEDLKEVDRETGEIDPEPEVPDEESTETLPDEPLKDKVVTKTEARDTVPTMASAPQVWREANCVGCGGPVYALHNRSEGQFPEVKFFHAEKCPLA